MAKNKKEEIIEEIVEPTTNNTPEKDQDKKLYKYEIGDEVFVMEDNKVKSFMIGKRIILTRSKDDGTIVTEVYYDESSWSSLKAQYEESFLYPSKKKLLESL